MRIRSNALMGALLLAAAGIMGAAWGKGASNSTPAPKAAQQQIVLAGGCFWGMEAVFESLKGVSSAVAGYAGGNKDTAHYEMVSTGQTGHAESVQITYDPSQITFAQLL